MSQTWTDDCFSGGHVAQTDMQNVENNFAALKSCFSGPTAPPNPAGNMWWADTTNNILKLRNEANTAWLNVYDFANQLSYGAKGVSIIAGTGLSGGGELTTDRTLSHGSHSGDVTGTESLILQDSKVTQAKLKTSYQSQSYDIPAGTIHKFSLTGGQYCFRPTMKGETVTVSLYDNVGLTTSYATIVCLKNTEDPFGSGMPRYGYVKHRYITSSGEVYWIFILRDKITKKTVATSCAPDHPCFSNEHVGNPELIQHPFGEGYDPNLHEILVVNPSEKQVREIKERAFLTPNRCMTQVIGEEYKINEVIFYPAWTNKEVTVGLPPRWKKMRMGDLIDPIRRSIPKPEWAKVATLKRKK